MSERRSRGDVEIFNVETAYDGFFKLDIYDFRYRRFDGAWSRRLQREVFQRGPTAAILLYDPVRDAVILVEQMRTPAINDPSGPWLLEAVAGIIDPGETAESVVRREAEEEAGVTVRDVVPLFDSLLSPGGCTERISMFVGLVDSKGVGGVHGLDHEDEDIRVVVWPFDQAFAEIGGKIVTAPAMICLQWLAMNRDRLRAKPFAGREGA
jgi:ADP-ribose pyrophosphatase